MSDGIFYLDEERGRENVSRTPSPRRATPSPNPDAGDKRVRAASTGESGETASAPEISVSSFTPAPPPTGLQIPPLQTSSLISPQPQPFTPSIRKHGNPFAATPSFPSPLAQAITVQHHSDASSTSSNHSDEENIDDRLKLPESPTHSGTSSGTPRHGGDLLLRPRTSSPSRPSTSRSPPPPTTPGHPQQALTPSSVLMRSRKSMTKVETLPNPLEIPADPNPRSASSTRQSSTRRRSSGRRREGTAPPSPTSPTDSSRRRSSNASSSSLAMPASLPSTASPLPITRPESVTSSVYSGHRRESASSGNSPIKGSREPNTLGLGLGSGWETASSASGSAPRDKGKSREGSGPPSPRVSRTESMSGLSSPPRQRRPSEFLSSSVDTRKILPVVPGGRAGGHSHISSLSTSASLVSPLNPLPSPWTTSSDNSATSPPHSLASEMSTTSATSGGGVMRLNRVPASVRMAADLIKSTSSANDNPSSSNSDSAVTTMSVPTPNPSPAGSVPKAIVMGPPSSVKAIGHTVSLPGPVRRAEGFLDQDTAPGSEAQPTTEPSTPPQVAASNMNVSPTATSTSDDAPMRQRTSVSVLAPPSSFKAPEQATQSRTRPSLPPSAEAPATSRMNRFRTSLHEAAMKPSPSSQDSPSGWSASSEGASSGSSGQKSAQVGLGLNMPPVTALPSRHGIDQPPRSMTPGEHTTLPRVNKGSTLGIQMDLAGTATLKDAKTHASMIMQSRQAKLQRWRPGSSGDQPSGTMAPPFGRSSSSGAAPVVTKIRGRSQDDDRRGPSPRETTSSMLQSSPHMPELSRIATLPSSPRPSVGETTLPPPAKQISGPKHFIPAVGGAAMDRQDSLGGGSVGGIEWVDWYDCYKRYKEEKIRAESEATRPRPAPFGEEVEEKEELRQPSRSEITQEPRTLDLGDDGNQNEGSSQFALSPTTSRDDFAEERLRKRSLSIHSSMSAMDPSRSPSLRRTNPFDRQRQSSGSSARSLVDSSTPGRRRKNLVTKMEGWWNAVKQNFSVENPPSRQVSGASSAGSAAGRAPTAPVSRRSSQVLPPPIGAPQPALQVPQPVHRESQHSLRQSISHAELRSASGNFDAQHLQEAANIVTASLRPITSRDMPPGMLGLSGRKPSVVPEEPSQLPSRVPSSLETRRRGGPNLRLELEPSVLTHPSSRPAGSSDSSNQGRPSDAGHHRMNETSSRSSSNGLLMTGAGLTPGALRWDETPSPIFPLGSESVSPAVMKEDRPVAPGAEITVANVRRHIKHRLEAAKVSCDSTLRRTIHDITKYVDEQKAREHAEAVSAALQNPPMDYFSGANESPIVDADDSETDAGLTTGERRRTSRQASATKSQSRRASVSRSQFASPMKQPIKLPGSPGQLRRRQSAVPRGHPQLLSQTASLTLDRTASASSSRSTSRSRSPLPTSTRGVLLLRSDEHNEKNKAFLCALQDLIVLAQDVMDMNVNTLLTRPAICTEIIQKLQKVGARWDETNNEWPGRNWYVDILMAVANLSRVLDWWEAEKGFWNFDEEHSDEPILFVVKPNAPLQTAREDGQFDVPISSLSGTHRSSSTGPSLLFSEPPTTSISLDLPSSDSTGPGGTARQNIPSPNHLGADDLKFLAEHAQSVNIVMELSLRGEEIEYVNDAMLEVTGRDPEEVIGVPITELLAPADAGVFSDATQKLVEDDNNTVQLRFRFEVHLLQKDLKPTGQPGPTYVELEGVGMLMRDDDGPSHTMWVLRPVLATQIQVDSIADAAFPREGRLSTEGVLCRICEREILAWFFEKHSETCDAVHRLEAEIFDGDECLRDLRLVVVDIMAQLEALEPVDDGSHTPRVVFYVFPESILSGHDHDALDGQHGVEVKKVDMDKLQEVVDVLSAARQIEIPSVLEDEADLPFNVQRYLSRESEEKLSRITQWRKPQTGDRAIQILLGQVEYHLRHKQKAVARMQNTIRYSEKTRHEWEDKVNQALGDHSESSPSESESDQGQQGSGDAPEPRDEKTELSPTTHRKIAPQARLPVTQGHPQRPSTSHTLLDVPATMPTTPINPPGLGVIGLTQPSSSSLVESAPKTLTPESFETPADPRVKTPSPLLTPSGKGHIRRTSSSRVMRETPISPRIPSAALQSRPGPTSIKDFEIIKPISRGAFGSVYLAKKVTTGDYFAIKALKKSDMIAKNQITNVKAERTILMNQATSPYVVKLFFSFQSKEYLYLVMEYLNGGDCATLIKTLGGLSEDWARNYIAEVVLGLEYLHSKNIVHRDIKPDNLLIDSRGHLKLTDFGLSRIGLLNRQVGGSRSSYLRGPSLPGLSGTRRSRPHSVPRNGSMSSNESPLLSPELLPAPPAANLSQSYFNTGSELLSADSSSGSESAGMVPRHLRTASTATNAAAGSGRDPFRFAGTPDYLSPETILGIGTDDRVVDWWALGVVLYEFLYGFPPFHADSPEKVFDNVVSRRINWHETEVDFSPEAHDLTNRLMCYDPNTRLGARGADEVKQHPFFDGIDWESLTSTEPEWIPKVSDPESTDYFDSRGAVHLVQEDDAAAANLVRSQRPALGLEPSPTTNKRMSEVIEDIHNQDDFGAFNFKNLPVLKQVNDDMVRKLRLDSMATMSQTLEGTAPLPSARRPRSLSTKIREKAQRKTSEGGSNSGAGPPSPTTSTSSAASTPSRASIPPSTPGSYAMVPPQHFRRPSELNALDRVKSSEDAELFRRSSAPSRVRTGSASSMSDRSTSMELWRQRRQVSLNTELPIGTIGPPLESPESHASMSSELADRTLDVLIAEDNPISQKILETLLTRMGCRCICVEDGPQALAAVMGTIRFDVIICDIHIPVVSGEQVARMIRSTNNHNQNTPIIACTSYEQSGGINEQGTLFSAILAKPVAKADLIRCLAKLGFILSSAGSQSATGDAMSTGTQ